ncbi:hypothetical protein PHMEG_00031925 [Phytophthora megakarya]|uniref:Retrotransposon gag domain-containing protein n=1 Tax=Phytophthora megakarya TaxID=4795 RepID=A0A225UVQ9_9STRA|nr:hypothetical protein PHMEG_00031925 [Phytophthora megakarya]
MAELRNQQEAFQQRLQLESAMQVQPQQDQLQKQQLRNEQQIERRLQRQQHGLSENIQALAYRLAQLDSLKPQTPVYERGVKPGSQFLMPEHSQDQRSPSPKSETLISRVHFEESLEHEKRRMQREFDDKLAQQVQSADVGQKNWLTNAQNAERERMLNSQWSNFEQQLKKREEEWKLEREEMATGIQNQMLTTASAVKRTESQVARRTAARKKESASSSSKRSQPKKAKKPSDPPPDDPDDSEPSDSDNDASRTGDSDSNLKGYTNLEKFDEKASRDNRVNWWERFSDMASQGSWSDTMKIRQFRSRMPTAIMDWLTKLPKSTRHDWKQMSRRFRKLFIGTTGSYSERYFTMKMTDHETPLQFFYRLNAAAVKAEVKFKLSSKLRESHIRRFIKKLRNDQLKTVIQGHRFQSITDLERAFRRHEDVWREEGYDSPAPKKPRGFRADNLHQGRSQNRGPARRQGRAFMPQGDAEPTQDSEFQHEFQNPEVFADQAEAHSKPIAEFPNGGIDGEVFRVAENQHWKSPNPHPGPGAARPENRDVFCEKCRKWDTLKRTVRPE